MNRQDWYLAALGVVRYVPRGSAVALDEEPLMPPPAAATLAITPPAREGRAALVQMLGATAEEPLPVAAAPPGADRPDTPVRDTSTPQPDTEVTAFRLAIWQPAPDLLFVDAMAPAEPPGAALAKLVANMAAALGRSVENAAGPQLVDWPPPRGRAEGGLEAARAMASAFCDARVVPEKISLVLLMGADTVRLVLPEATDYSTALAHTRRWRELDAVVTPSLSELIHDPAAKRRVWQAVAPFARSVH